jgi:hypothetical protein
MSTQITGQKTLSFATFNDFANLPGVEGFIYIDNSANVAYLWDSVALTYVNIAGEPEPPIPPDPIPLLFVSAATSGAITPVPNYDNGPANDGVGATLIGGVDGALTDGTAPEKIDFSYTPTAGGIILVKDQTVSTNLSLNKAFQNGVYLIVNPGSLTSKYELLRLPDYDTTTGLYPLQVNATGGTNNVTRYYIQTTVTPVIGTNNATGNLIFPLTTGQSVSSPIAFVDTVIDTTLPDSVYANGTAFLTVPGNGATLTATAFGPLGTHNGLTATLDNNSVTGFRRALVINQPSANAAYNGDYVVVRPGSIYTSAAGATSVGTTINVTSVTGLVVGMTVTVFSGTGAFAANTTVTSINIPLNRFTVSIAPTTPLSGGATVVRAGTTWQLRRIQTGAAGFDRYTRCFMVSNTGSTKAGKYYFATPNAAPLTNNSSLAPFNTGIGVAPINIVEYGGASAGPFGIANSSGVYTYYATMTLAMTAASAGQTVEVFADVTETGNVEIVLKNGVNINGNGHTYTLDNTGTINAFKIADAVGDTTYNLSILNLNIIRKGSTGTLSNNNALYIGTSTLGSINCSGSIFKNSGDGNGIYATCKTFDINYAVGYSISTAGIYSGTSNDIRFNNCIGYSVSGSGIQGQNGGVFANCSGYSDSGNGINANSGTFISCNGYSLSSVGFLGGGSLASNCTGRSFTGTGFQATNGQKVVNCTGLSDTGVGFRTNMKSYNCSGFSRTSRAFYLEGSAEAHNITARSEAHHTVFATTSTSKIYGGMIICEYANSEGWAIRGNGGTISSVIINCTMRLASLSTPYLFNDGTAASISMRGNTFIGGGAFNPNITNASILATEDSQGNIYL